MTIDELIENFELLGDWEERYAYLIDLGKKLPAMPEAHKNDATKVQGCMSNVWLYATTDEQSPPRFRFEADSDAFIVKGLVSLLLTVYAGHTAEEILAIDAEGMFDRLGLQAHLSPTRANGLHAMVERIRAEAHSQTA
ncbi:MAG: SufE family protein [Chromatiales bacterium]|nr:SufE family protein [Chromatiales bacterium]